MSESDSWCHNKTVDPQPQLTVNLGDVTSVTRIATQGLADRYVISFYMDYSEDGRNWMQYMEQGRRKRYTF